MVKDTRLKAVVVGCGSIGSLYDEYRRGADPRSHAGAYFRNPRTRLVAGADTDATRREKFSKMWGVRSYEDYKDMFARERPEIVSVCTWPESHAEITIAAAEAGARAVICEKPLADSLINGHKLVNACEVRNVCLAVNHSRRWDEAHRQIRDFLASGQLGNVQHVTVQYVRGIANSGSHIVDLLRFFFGEVDWVRAFDRLRERDPDPALDGYIMMRSGVGCSMAGLLRGNYDIFDWDIIGTAGRLKIEDLGYRTRLWRLAPHPDWPDRHVFIEAQSPFPPGLRRMMTSAVDNIVQCVTLNATPLDTGRDGLAALETVTALKKSAAAGGERVNLPLQG